MKRLTLLFVTVFALFALAAPAFAEDAITVTSNKFTNNFRKNLTFVLGAQSAAGKITNIALLIQLEGIASSGRQIPDFSPGAQVQATYEWNLERNYLPPGVSGQFWWLIEDDKGNQKQTEKQNFRVEDTSQQWKKLANSQVALYWYAGGDSFGKALFDRAVEAMQYLQQDTKVSVERQIQIFIYGNRNDFFKAIPMSSKEWTGGQAYTEYSIVVINVEPNSLEWGKDATVHELTHQIISQKIRGPLGDLSMPHWMDEGLAMYYETYPNPLDNQFAAPLKRAIQNDTLMTVRSMVGAFPTDSAAANLAYAQSYSLVDFIIRKYGRDKLAQLLQDFKTGGFYDDVFKKALGVDTDGLETEWRKDIGAKPRVIPTRGATTPTPFPTFSLSTDPFVAPTAAAKPSATPQVVAVQATAAPPAPTAAPSNPLRSVALCNSTGLIVLGVIATAWQIRRRRPHV